MMDWMATILVNGGDVAVTWLLVFLFGSLSALVLKTISNTTVQAILVRATEEVKDAVLEVEQTYVKALKAANADGKLTDEEKKAAMDKAIAIAKSNIGMKGLKRLARVVGIDAVTSWLETKAEATVATIKKPAVAPPSLSPAG